MNSICPVCNESVFFNASVYIICGTSYYHYNCYYRPLSEPIEIDAKLLNPETKIKQKPKKRDDWNTYFIKMADFVSTRATCDRRHCGTVITKNNRVVSTGYNGSAIGDPHCDDVGHFLVNNSCKRTIHAEINAIQDAKTKFENLEGCILYTNTYPCINCFWEIMKTGIKQIYYKGEYAGYVANENMEKVSAAFGIKITKINVGDNA